MLTTRFLSSSATSSSPGPEPGPGRDWVEVLAFLEVAPEATSKDAASKVLLVGAPEVTTVDETLEAAVKAPVASFLRAWLGRLGVLTGSRRCSA